MRDKTEVVEKFTPHDYQKYAIKFIIENPVVALFLDLGLGKTVIALTAVMELMFHRFEINKVLVIAPLRVAKNTWGSELDKWAHLAGIRYSVVVGSVTQRLAALKTDADIYIINRENLPWLIDKSGYSFDFDMVIIDELSSMKNWNAKRVRAFMKVRPFVRRVVGLTGTPSSNGLMDLYSEFKCLDMGERLGRLIGQYRVDFFVPDKMNGPVVYSYKPLPGAEERIYRRISDITISMKATDHLKMPELISNEYKVYLSEREKAIYDEMCDDLVVSLKDSEITAANAATLCSKLSQLANGAIYDDDGSVVEFHGRKLDALEDIIEGMNNQPLLVAYWYRHDLERITKRLTERKFSFEKLDSDESIARWNRKEIPVALIHPASAGHGLNLQAGGHTLCWFGITWSLELYQQTVGRLYRQGQKSGTVVIQHIITDKTIDERILKALSKKESSQEALIDAVKASV